jgi:hypothetical protein
MLIKFDADEDLVEKLKAQTRSAVASKAFHYAGIKYLELLDQNADMHRRNAQLRDELEACKQIISGARLAAVALIERVGQDDMFIN